MPRSLRYALVTLGLAALVQGGVLTSAALAQESTATDVSVAVIPRADGPPNLDDYAAGEPANAGLKITQFQQFAPNDGQPVSLPTAAYLSYDDRNLYVVFVCQDDPKLVRAHLGKREDIFGDEGVELFLDTFDDNQRAYLFAINPFGVQLDGVLTEGQGYNFDFDTVWDSDGRLTANGFVASMTIPWKSLRFPRTPTQKWGFALARIIPRANEFSYYPLITQRISGVVNQFASLEIPAAISPGRNLQFIPYAAASRARLLADEPTGARFRTDTETRAGLDAKLVVHDAVAVDLTVQPDFSQVESDEPQVIVNQRFEVFFPEKRPFFLENAGFFNTPINLFFSRRILDPRVGARVTGKVDRWAFGALAIDDDAPRKLTNSNDRAEMGVFRLQREIGRQSSVGLFTSQRNQGGTRNQVTALDGRFQLNDAWVATAQAVATDTSGSEDLSGSGYQLQLDRQGFNFVYSGSYLDLSDDLRTDLGFVPRVGIRQLAQTAQYLWKPEGGKLVSYGPSLSYLGTWDQDGETQDWDVTGTYSLSLTRQTNFSASLTRAFERFLGFEFDKSAWEVAASSEPLNWLIGSLSYHHGDAINFLPAAGLDPFLGTEQTVQASITLRPIHRLRVDQFYIYTQLRSQGAVADRTTGARTVFSNALWRTKLNYQLSRSASLRVILDYSALSPTASLVGLERDRRLTGDVLFTYLPHPGTAIYVGYTENYQNLQLLPTTPPSIGRTRSADTSTGRQVFVKVSYLFRY